MTRLSVNINKIATLRNARGANTPDLIQMARDCESFGAEGITVHPRPDERHITYNDVMQLKDEVRTEFNIEGYPDDRFLEIIEKAKPDQATLVPDKPDAITSDHGWDTISEKEFLINVVSKIQEMGVRVSIFADPDIKMIEGAKETGTDRIELYTEPYASGYSKNRDEAVASYVSAASIAQELDLGINAGHDLSLENLKFFNEKVPGLLEVSIGHALISDALYYGIGNTIQMYKRLL